MILFRMQPTQATRLYRRMEGSVHLQRAFDALHESEENGQGQNQNRYPKCVPLHSIPPVVPPLRYRARPRLVVHLLQYHQSIVPVAEALHLSLVGDEVATLNHFGVQPVPSDLDAVQLPELFVVLWEEQSEGSQRLGDEVWRE